MTLALLAVAAIGIGGYVAYDNVLRGDNIAALSLPSSAPVASAAGTSAAPGASTAPGAASPVEGAGFDGDITGEWAVVDGSIAGYRVREQLASLPAESEAVGRTSDVTGSISLEAVGDAARLTAGTLTVDTTTLASDEDRRDNRLRTEGLQTDQFPTATFTLTQPIDVPAVALAGTPTDVTLVGDLTLHGVTKPVTIPSQAQLVSGTVSVLGSLPFALSDFEITPPNVGGFIISIADQGTLEFSVNFTRG